MSYYLLASSRILGDFSGSALFSTHRLLSRPEPSQAWNCCSWWSFHGTDMSIIAGIPCCYWNELLSLASCRLFLGTPALLHNARRQLFSMTFSCIQNHLYLGDSCISKLGCPQEVQPWRLLKHSFGVVTLKKHFPEDLPLIMLGSC